MPSSVWCMGGPTTMPARSGSSATGSPTWLNAWRKLDTMPEAESVSVPSRSKITSSGGTVTQPFSPIASHYCRSVRFHGDRAAFPGILDFAVNVRGAEPPQWLLEKLAARLPDLGRYPSRQDED